MAAVHHAIFQSRCKNTVFYSAEDQSDNVAQDFVVRIERGHCFGAAALQQPLCLSDGFGLKAVGGNLRRGDDGFCFVDMQGDVDVAPWELRLFRGLELSPATEEEVVRSDMLSDGLHRIVLNQGAEIQYSGFASVHLLKRGDKRLLDAFRGQIRHEFAEVDDSAGHALHAVFHQFGLVDDEVTLHHRAIGLDEEGPVVQVVLFPLSKGIAREFASLAGEVIAPRDLGFKSIGEERVLDDGELLAHVIQRLVGDEREVDVAQVVVDGAAACAATHQMTAFIEQQLDVAFRIGILVIADDDGLLVFPEVHRNGAFLLLVREILLHGAVEEGIVLVADDD